MMRKQARTLQRCVTIFGAILILAGLWSMDMRGGSGRQVPGVYTGNLGPRATQHVPGQVLVKFADTVGQRQAQAIVDGVGAEIVGYGYRMAFTKLRVPEERLWRIIAALERNPLVEYADPDWIVHASGTPNDPYYKYQWHLDNDTFGGIHVEGAWSLIGGGAPTVFVAVLDTGVAYENYDRFCRAPDLAGTSFLPGYDFINGDAHANDDNGHGTHVAGTIAQTTDNSIGTAGVAYNTTLVPVKVLGADGSGPVSAIADGIRWSADFGVHIINMSLGVNANPRRLRALHDAVKYADQLGILQIAAAGNAGRSSLDYPAGYPEVVAVGATVFDNTLAYYSNYGDGLELVAPGGTDKEDLSGDGFPDMVLQNTFNLSTGDVCDFNYWFMAGTSMAAPHVSGTAALLFAAGAADRDEVRDILRQTADDLGEPGYNTTYGYGIVNASAAVAALGDRDTPPTVAIASPVDGEAVYGTVTVAADATDDDAVTQVEFFIDGVSIGVDSDGSDGWSVAWDTTLYEDGAYTVTATATDTAGQTASDSIGVEVDNIDDPPTVAITHPGDGATVAGTITIQADATDDDAVTQVEFFIDGVSIGVDSDGSDGWSVAWDTTLYEDGAYTVTATATDTAGQTASDSIGVSVDNTAPPRIHVGNLEGVSINEGPTWRADVTVTVHDSSHNPVEGATVDISWSGGYSGTASASTDSNGQCAFVSGSMAKRISSVTLTVTDISHPDYAYDESANHDPDGDSDGTSITVTK